MVVLCGNPMCGAVLRSASVDSPLTAVLLDDVRGRFFVCPRCFQRTDVMAVSGDMPRDDDPPARPPAMR